MDYKQLSYFLAIAEEHSFSKASQHCFISQQALSKAIHNLETELNCTLFERTPQGIELTERGRKLRKYSLTYVEYHKKIMKEMSEAQDEDKPFLLGYATGMLQQFPRDFLTRFILKYPNKQFKVVSYPDDSYNRSLLNYELDVSFCSTLPLNEEVKVLYHFRHKTFLLLSKNHPLAEKDEIMTKDLVNISFISLNNDTQLVANVDKASRQFRFKNEIVISPSEYDLCYELLKTRKYVSLYATHYYDPSHELVKREIHDLDIYYDFYMITQKDTPITPLMQDLINQVKEEMEKQI